MRIITDIPGAKLKEAVSGGARFAVFAGRIVGEERADLPDWRDNAWALKRGADLAIEQAAAASGHPEFDADPVEIGAILVSAEGEEIITRVWADRAEALA